MTCDANQMRVDCARQISSMEQMLKDEIKRNCEERKRLYTLLERLEARMIHVEKFQNILMGFGVLLGALGSFIWSAIKSAFS